MLDGLAELIGELFWYASSAKYIEPITSQMVSPSHQLCELPPLALRVHCSGPVHAAAAAKLLQSCPALCDPIDASPPGSPVPGILQARALEWVAISSPMHESEK